MRCRARVNMAARKKACQYRERTGVPERVARVGW